MSEDFRYDVFISYSHQDEAWVVGTLVPQLEGVGLRVCIDRHDFEIGAVNVTEMERAVAESRKTLLVLTPAYVASDWTAFENVMLQTRDPLNRKLQLIPLLKEQCEIPPRLAIFNYIDFTKDGDWDRLVTALGGIIHKDPPAAPTRADWDLVHPYGMPPNFTGRQAERAMLSAWLAGDGPALFVLRALGGFGKSALVWHWLRHDVEPANWPRVLWWCFYEPEAPFDRLLARTLKYLGIDPKSLGPREQLDAILATLRRPGILLVLDGFERELRAFSGMGAAYQGDEEAAVIDTGDRDCVSPSAEVFLRALVSLPELRGRVLMTTRLRPRILETRSGELLAGCREEELLAMHPEDAVDFFHAEGIQGNRAEIMSACEPYGYHPLSLRLLAGLVLRDPRTPRDIAVARRLDVSGDLVQRKHHVLQQAYESLQLSHRRLLSRIACFRGPVSYEAIGTAAKTSPEEVDEALLEFESRGLLHRDRVDGRFDIHPIVRRYAYDRLGQKKRQAAHRALRDYFAAVPPTERVQTLVDITPVIELYHHMVRAGEYDAACHLFSDRLHVVTYFKLGAYELNIELLGALFPDGEDLPPRLRDERDQAWALNVLANSYSLAGQPRRAVSLYEHQNEICERLSVKRNLAVGLGNLACMAQISIGDLRAAEANLRQQIVLCQEIKDAAHEANGHVELGRCLIFRGRWDDAGNELGIALEVFEDQGHIHAQGVGWAYRGFRHLALARIDASDDAAQALTAARRSLELADEGARTQYPVLRSYVRAHWLLGAAYRETGDLAAAERHLNESLTRCRRINMVDHEADILLDLARLRLKTGDPAEARRLAAEALAITERCGYVLQGADVHLLLARLELDAGHLDAAREHAAEARRLATCDGPPDYTYKVAFDEAGALLEALTPRPPLPSPPRPAGRGGDKKKKKK